MTLIQIKPRDSEVSIENSSQQSNINLNIPSNTSIDIWLADLTYTQQQISSELMPQAIGGIATFTEYNLKLVKPIKIFKYPEKLVEQLEKHGAPQIIGFSNYMWNIELSLSFAHRIKEIAPDTIIIMGGPNFPFTPSEQELFLRNHPDIDFYVSGEAELAFANLIASLVNSNLNKNEINNLLPSVHFINKNDQACIAQSVERIRDLSEIPSPYTTGKLDEFFDGKLQPAIQTTRGCPFSCTFCVEGMGYYSKIHRNSQEKVNSELEYIAKKMINVREQGGRNDLGIVDSNFGMYSQDIETCKIIQKHQITYGWPEYIQVDTGKNNKARTLEAASLVGGAIRLSGAVQSLDEEVLKNIKRSNISGDGLIQLAKDASTIDADSRAEIILALPGESYNSHFDTLRTIINADFNHVNTYQLMMLPGTENDAPEIRKNFDIQTGFRVLPRCFGFFNVLGKTIVAAEIEEICIGNNTMTFEDYVNCRKMHLLIHIFHNDELFHSALKFIKSLDLPIFRWLEIIFETKSQGNVKTVFDLFEKDTKEEVNKSFSELEQSIDESTVKRYVNGELGYNLLFVYKTIAINDYLIDFMELAKNSIFLFLKENGKDTSENLSFVESCLKFDMCRLTNVFSNIDHDPTITISHDILSFIEEKNASQHYILEKAKTLKFTFSENQKDIIKRSLSLYGDNTIGISFLLSKVFVKRLLREPIFTEL